MGLFEYLDYNNSISYKKTVSKQKFIILTNFCVLVFVSNYSSVFMTFIFWLVKMVESVDYG
jgi:hypothetical protein